jgi:hypothetical protein
MNYAQEFEKAINFIRDAAQWYEFHYGAVGDKDKELQDPDHELELAAKDAKERSRISRERQRVLRERRKHKDIAESTEPIAKFVEANRKLMNDLGAVLGKVRKVEEYHRNRQYNPRVRTDLTIGTKRGSKG